MSRARDHREGVVRPHNARLRSSGHLVDQALRTTSRPPSTTGGRGEICASRFSSSIRFCSRCCKVSAPPARLARVEARAGLAGLLFERELRGTVVPVRDLLGEAVLHGRFGLVDQREPGRTDFREMFRDDVGDGVRLHRLLQIPADPGALGPFEERVDRRLVVRQRPVAARANCSQRKAGSPSDEPAFE